MQPHLTTVDIDKTTGNAGSGRPATAGGLNYLARGKSIALSRISYILGISLWIVSILCRCLVNEGLPSTFAVALLVIECLLLPGAIFGSLLLFTKKESRFMTAYHQLSVKRNSIFSKTCAGGGASLSTFFSIVEELDETEYSGDGKITIHEDSAFSDSKSNSSTENDDAVVAVDIESPKDTSPVDGDNAFYKSVDVFITCYKEEDEIIQATLTGALFLQTPPWIQSVNVYLLDDGAKSSRQEMCQASSGMDNRKATYVCRPKPGEHAKAGNLNYGLSISEGSLFVVLDADMIPTPKALLHLCACMEEADPSVAFIQSPQKYRDVRKCDLFGSTNSFFLERCQSLYGGSGYACFIGTGAIFRRDAVMDVGAFPTKFCTEDFALTAQLHMSGYRSIYTPFHVAYGTSPQTMSELFTQRIRWWWGTTEVLMSHKGSFLCAPGYSMVFRTGMANLLVSTASAPLVLFLITVFALAAVTNSPIVPSPPEVRITWAYVVFLKISSYLFVDAHFSPKQKREMTWETYVNETYYLGALVPVMSLYLNTKYLLTWGKNIKFKSVGGVKGPSVEHLVILAGMLGFSLFCLACSGIGIYQSMPLTFDSSGNFLLSAFLVLEGLRYLTAGCHVIKPFPSFSGSTGAASNDPQEVEAAGASSSIQTRWMILVMIVPTIQFAGFCMVIIYSAFECVRSLIW